MHTYVLGSSTAATADWIDMVVCGTFVGEVYNTARGVQQRRKRAAPASIRFAISGERLEQEREKSGGRGIDWLPSSSWSFRCIFVLHSPLSQARATGELWISLHWAYESMYV